MLYFGSSKGIGITYHLAIASKYFAKMKDIDFTLISGNKEQFDGLFDLLKKNNIRYKTVQDIDEISCFLRNIGAFLNFVKKEGFDVIHAQTNTHLMYCIIAKLFFKTKIIYTVHAFRHGKAKIISNIFSFFLSIVLNIFSDIVITQCTIVQKHFKKMLLKSTLLPLGYEPFEVDTEKDKKELKIIYVAKFHRHKNQLWLIRSLSHILGAYNDIKLVLPGNGEYLPSCKDEVEKIGLGNKIVLPGWLSRYEIAELLKKSNLAIIPSNYETFGHNIIEPMFYKIPVISFPVGIAPDVIRNDSNGYLIGKYDSKGLQEKVLFFYENREKLLEYGEKAYEIAMRELTWNTIAMKYREYILLEI